MNLTMDNGVRQKNETKIRLFYTSDDKANDKIMSFFSDDTNTCTRIYYYPIERSEG